MHISVSDTVIKAITDCFQDEHRIQEGLAIWERHKPDLSSDQTLDLKAAYAAAQAKLSDPLRFLRRDQ